MRKFFYLILFSLSLPITAYAQELYEQGKHYTVLGSTQPVETGDKVEVRELFWYGCPHCFKLEDGLEAWVETMPEDAAFVRMPAIFSKVWEQHAKIYYLFEAMGNLDEMHRKVFDAIHIDKQKLVKDDEIIEFAVEQGLDKQTVEETLESFTVSSKVNAAKTNIAKYQVTGVPAMVVAGKYLTDVTAAGGERRMFEVIEFLINKAKAES